MIYCAHVSHLMRNTLLRGADDNLLTTPIQYVSTWKWREELPLSLDHTYIVIFSKNQYESGIKLLKNTPKLKILFESVGAYNGVHPTASSNTVVVFELEQGFKPE